MQIDGIIVWRLRCHIVGMVDWFIKAFIWEIHPIFQDQIFENKFNIGGCNYKQVLPITKHTSAIFQKYVWKNHISSDLWMSLVLFQQDIHVQQLQGDVAQLNNAFYVFLRTSWWRLCHKKDKICVLDDMCVDIKSLDGFINNMYEAINMSKIALLVGQNWFQKMQLLSNYLSYLWIDFQTIIIPTSFPILLASLSIKIHL